MAGLRLAGAALAPLDEPAEGHCAADDAIDRAWAGPAGRDRRALARIDGDQAAEPDGLTDRGCAVP